VEYEKKMIPALIGATVPSQKYRKCLNKIPGKDDMK
jgi:hypothetical protein